MARTYQNKRRALGFVMLTNQSQTVNRAPKTHKIFNKSAPKDKKSQDEPRNSCFSFSSISIVSLATPSGPKGDT